MPVRPHCDRRSLKRDETTGVRAPLGRQPRHATSLAFRGIPAAIHQMVCQLSASTQFVDGCCCCSESAVVDLDGELPWCGRPRICNVYAVLARLAQSMNLSGRQTGLWRAVSVNDECTTFRHRRTHMILPPCMTREGVFRGMNLA